MWCVFYTYSSSQCGLATLRAQQLHEAGGPLIGQHCPQLSLFKAQDSATPCSDQGTVWTYLSYSDPCPQACRHLRIQPFQGISCCIYSIESSETQMGMCWGGHWGVWGSCFHHMCCCNVGVVMSICRFLYQMLTKLTPHKRANSSKTSLQRNHRLKITPVMQAHVDTEKRRTDIFLLPG